MDAADYLESYFAARAIEGVEIAGEGRLRRTLRAGAIELHFADDSVTVLAGSADEAVAAGERLLGLRGDRDAAATALRDDPLLGPLVRARPGLRAPGGADPFEILVRAIVGQQISVPAARTVLGRLAEAYGEPWAAGDGLTRVFPSPAQLAAADPADLPMPGARARALLAASAAVAAGAVTWERDALLALPGVGPWTADYVLMRGLGDPDVFLPGDLGVRRALAALGGPSDPRAAAELAERWRPWRSYATHHLWASLA